MQPRLFLDKDLFLGAELSLENDAYHYLAHVMRVQNGQEILVFNGRQGLWRAAFSIQKKRGFLLLCHQVCLQPSQPPPLVLAFAFIKRYEWVIEKAVELGATTLIPLSTARTVLKKVSPQRLEKMALEACEQSHRLHIPRIEPLLPLKTFLQTWAFEKSLAILDIDSPQPPKGFWSSVQGLLVGPEGGWSQEEVGWLVSHPYLKPVGLGPGILRAETAAIAGLSLIGFSAH